MRISRSGGPDSSPPLASLPPMERSWALEAEREACMHGEDKSLHSYDTGMEHTDHASCWNLSKTQFTAVKAGKVEKELTSERASERASKTSYHRHHKNGMHALSRYNDSNANANCMEWRPREQSFTTSSRCYAPTVHAGETYQFSRRTGAANHVTNTGQVRQRRSSKAKRPAGFEALHNQEELECKPAKKSSFKGDRENDVSSRQWRSAIRRRYNDAAAYNGIDSSRSKEERSMINLGHILRLECNTEMDSAKIEQCDEQEQYEMLASLLLDESVSSVAYTDSKEPESESGEGDLMEIDDGAKSNVITTASLGSGSPAKSPEPKNRNKFSSANSMQRDAQRTSDSLGLRPSRQVLVDVSNKFELDAAPGVKEEVQETDAHRLSQRQRQIDFGKNTLGYERYTELVPRLKRKARDPQTPDAKQVCSKRSWDGQIRKWRRLLHIYDPPSEDGEESAEDLSAHYHLNRGCLHQASPNAADIPTLPTRDVEPNGNRSVDALEGVRKEDASLITSDQRVADANLTIYDDWMES